MDNFAGLLDAPRARGAFTLRTVMRSPWSLRIEAESPITLIAGVSGTLWVVPDAGDPVQVGPGDIALTRAPDHYNVSETPSSPPQVIILPGQDCRNLAGESVKEEMMHGVRTWGNEPDGSTVFLVGAYEGLSDISDRLLHSLPPVLSLGRAEWDSPLISLLSDEVVCERPGQAAVLDRLLDLLLTAVLRAWFAKEDAKGPAWWRLQSDPVVDRALKLMHENPAHHWTLDVLASKAGASRASFARRFNELVGETPMTFLKNWRLAIAADLLCQPGETIGTVAEKVGYSSPYAFSTAFKRVRGISPKEHREQATLS